jgi:hypothetical protein
MSFTYDAAQLGSNAVARTRLTIGDTTECAGLLPGGANFSDEEIRYTLTRKGDETATAVHLLRLAATKWTVSPKSFSSDGLSINYGDFESVAKRLQDQADQLMADSGAGSLTSHTVALVGFEDDP